MSKYLNNKILNLNTNKITKKFVASFYCAFFFSFIYSLFSNNNFIIYHHKINKKKARIYLEQIFNKYQQNGSINENIFMNLPFDKYNNNVYIKWGDKVNLKLNKKLFSFYDATNDKKLSKKEFLEIPIDYSRQKLNTGEFNDIKHFYDNDYLNRLYFSIVTQFTIGYGDIVPISNILKLIVMCQIILAFYIIVFY